LAAAIGGLKSQAYRYERAYMRDSGRVITSTRQHEKIIESLGAGAWTSRSRPEENWRVSLDFLTPWLEKGNGVIPDDSSRKRRSASSSKALVRIPSVNPTIAPSEAHGEAAVAAFACDWLEARGSARRSKSCSRAPNVVAGVGAEDGPTLFCVRTSIPWGRRG